MDITVKSTGFLIDELITTRFKVEVNPTPEIIHRMRVLDAAIRLRLNGREDDIYLPVIKLQIVLRQCWEAQEIIMKNQDISYTPYMNDNYFQLKCLAEAAVKAQKTNAARNKLIQEIDTILNEAPVSVLGKTYE
jgi:hypothetical protein